MMWRRRWGVGLGRVIRECCFEVIFELRFYGEREFVMGNGGVFSVASLFFFKWE